MMQYADFAILAPVPAEHLESGKVVAAAEGFVAFGSGKFEFFLNVEERRGDAVVPVLIYPSYEDDEAKMKFVVSWFGLYTGFVNSDHGAHPSGMKHRPPTTAQYQHDNKGHWAVFWHVKNLIELPQVQRQPISTIQTIKGGWRKNHPPRGPELVAIPSHFNISDR